MSKFGQVEFLEKVEKAYMILWAMHDSGDWDTGKDEKLVNMLNTIDNELGR
ncbi:unnamed protein product [marine sediment metagenome]|uniref:Uncharacterized protein n=1 Tax=marine sediment metagenome TaxID=412755 RepID=X0UQV0_9ZZZZ